MTLYFLKPIIWPIMPHSYWRIAYPPPPQQIKQTQQATTLYVREYNFKMFRRHLLPRRVVWLQPKPISCLCSIYLCISYVSNRPPPLLHPSIETGLPSVYTFLILFRIMPNSALSASIRLLLRRSVYSCVRTHVCLCVVKGQGLTHGGGAED